jgi:hypothetical protein
MVKLLFFRLLNAVGLFALGLVLVGAVPLLNAGAGIAGKAPGVDVNRSLKRDRLPAATPLFTPDWQYEFGWWPSTEPRAQIPFACEAAISTILAPSTVNIYRRCMA